MVRFLAILLLFPSILLATYHEVTIVDENGRIASDVTSIYIYQPGTVSLATIYKDRNKTYEMAQPITASSENTTLQNGVVRWWGDDLYDYAVSNGTVTATNFNTDSFSSNNGRIVFLSNLFNGTTAYTRTILDDSDEATFKATVNLETGTDVQAWDTDLDWLSTGLSSFNKSYLDDSDEAAFKATLNLEVGTDTQAWDTDLDWLAANITAFARTLLDDSDQATAQTTLGLGTTDSPTFTGLTIGNDSNSLSISPQGHLTLNGDATVFDDIRVAASSAKLLGNSDPDWEVFQDGVYGLAFATNVDQEVFFQVQIPHGWKLGTDLDAHVHWAPSDANTLSVTWDLEYTIADIGGTFGSTTTISATDPGDGTAFKHQYADLGDIDLSSYTDSGDVSIILMCRLYRDVSDGDDYPSDAFLLEVDFHYEMDSLGSNLEASK